MAWTFIVMARSTASLRLRRTTARMIAKPAAPAALTSRDDLEPSGARLAESARSHLPASAPRWRRSSPQRRAISPTVPRHAL